MPDDFLARLKAAEAKATPRPWVNRSDHPDERLKYLLRNAAPELAALVEAARYTVELRTHTLSPEHDDADIQELRAALAALDKAGEEG